MIIQIKKNVMIDKGLTEINVLKSKFPILLTLKIIEGTNGSILLHGFNLTIKYIYMYMYFASIHGSPIVLFDVVVLFHLLAIADKIYMETIVHHGLSKF